MALVVLLEGVKRLGNAGYLLGQDPHGDAVVPGTKPEIDQLARAAFHIFRSRAVVEHKERVGPREEEASQAITKMCGSRSTKPS